MREEHLADIIVWVCLEISCLMVGVLVGAKANANAKAMIGEFFGCILARAHAIQPRLSAGGPARFPKLQPPKARGNWISYTSQSFPNPLPQPLTACPQPSAHNNGNLSTHRDNPLLRASLPQQPPLALLQPLAPPLAKSVPIIHHREPDHPCARVGARGPRARIDL